MRSGDLDRKITIQAVDYVFDEYGSFEEVWTDMATVWASFTQSGGREFFAHATIVSERKVVFRCRWVEGVTVIHRVICDGDIFDINEVRRIGRKIGLELHCTAE